MWLRMPWMLQEGQVPLSRGHKEGRHVFSDILRQREAFCLRDLEITGRDLIDLGVPRGPKVGEVLSDLLDMVIDSPQKNNRKLLLTEVKKRITIE